MEKYWRLFAGWVTNLKNDPFQRARIKLTIVYTIVTVFAQIFYLGLLYREFDRQAHTFALENVPVIRRSIFLKRASTVARETLFSIQYEDVGMFFITLGISYLIAGIALQPIKTSLQKQKQFLADTSHELKTPLTIIKTELEVFLRSKQNIGGKELHLRNRKGVISNLEEIERMQQIIDNLLTLSRIENYENDFAFTKYSALKVIDQTVQKLQETAKRKHIVLSIEANDPFDIPLDKVKFSQAIFNIVYNAIKYTKNGGKVHIMLKKNKNHAVISISDTGVGIAKTDLPYIFERFFRSNTQFTKRVSGTGLGLAITKLIIEKHNGIISIDSVLNQGTTVIIQLPLL